MTALRMLRRNRTFAAVAVLSLGLALAANTAVFSFVNAIVLKRLPVPGADRLVIVRQQNEMFHMENARFSYAFFRELRKQDSDFEDVAAVHDLELNLTERDETERLAAEIVSGNYFRMLGVNAVAGRLLDESDDGAEGTGRGCGVRYRPWQ